MSLIPAFEVGVWNAWILVLAVMFFHAVGPLLAAQFNAEYKKRFSESPSDVYVNKTEKRSSTFTLVILLLLLIYPVFLPLQLGTAWFYTGLSIFILGVITGQLPLIPFLTTPIDEPVTTGIYRYSRHPIYFAGLVQLVGIGIASASWLFLLFTTVLMFLMNTAIIPEERGCLEKYDDAYREYMNRTPRWIGIPKSR